MRHQRYAGVSGFMSRSEVDAALELCDGAPPGWLMVGVLASWKTVFGTGNSHPNRYPKPRDWHRLFVDDPRVLNFVHYAPGEQPSPPLAYQLLTVVDLAGPNVHGIQINAAEPDPREIDLFRKHYPGMRVVLQVGPAAMAGVTIGGIARRTAKCRDVCTDVLIDVSAGHGKAIEPYYAHPLARSIRSEIGPNHGIGIAGGLCADALPAVADLVREHDLSVDAEGKLRHPETDHMNIDAMQAYLHACRRIRVGGIEPLPDDRMATAPGGVEANREVW